MLKTRKLWKLIHQYSTDHNDADSVINWFENMKCRHLLLIWKWMLGCVFLSFIASLALHILSKMRSLKCSSFLNQPESIWCINCLNYWEFCFRDLARSAATLELLVASLLIENLLSIVFNDFPCDFIPPYLTAFTLIN